MSKRKHKPEKLIATYVDAANEIMSHHFNPDCCINGTRVAIDALATFGVRVFPHAVEFTVFNEVFWGLIEKHKRFPTDDQELQQWCEQGGWSVGVAPGINGNGFSGHVVGLVKGRIIDSAVGQFHRPAKGIHLPSHAAVIPLGEDFLRGVATVTEGEAGCITTYRRIADTVAESVSFHQTPGFQKSPHNVACATEIVDRMREMLSRKTG